ncbi:hypothetical protein QE152_g13083 [Popillia japonica]|uniref:Uncharacterized protein n=1 Tax=Popillia japonica TaxID=7064 RepID=A0AAW1LGK5_POPJA
MDTGNTLDFIRTFISCVSGPTSAERQSLMMQAGIESSPGVNLSESFAIIFNIVLSVVSLIDIVGRYEKFGKGDSHLKLDDMRPLQQTQN